MKTKKYILFIFISLFGFFTVHAQKSVIDLFLEENPSFEKQVTCVNITEDKLTQCYEHSTLKLPKRYQSISLCNASDIAEKFEKNTAFKKYTLLQEIKKDNGSIVRYFQNVQEKKGKKIDEIIIYMHCHNDFSVIYLRGDDLSKQTLNAHLEIIRNFIDNNKCKL